MMAPQPLQKPYRLRRFGVIVSAFTGLCIFLTVGLAFILSCSNNNNFTVILSNLITPSQMILLLRVFNEVTNMAFGLLIAITLNAVLWSLASSKKGVEIPTLLGLTASTGFMGLCKLLFLWGKGPYGTHKYVAFMRLSFIALLPLMGIILSARITQRNPDYAIQGTPMVSATVYDFNSSVVLTNYLPWTALYTFTSLIQDLLSNSALVHPIANPENPSPGCPLTGQMSCFAYLFPSALNPSIVTISNNLQSATTNSGDNQFDFEYIEFPSLQGALVNFWGPNNGLNFMDGNTTAETVSPDQMYCNVFGAQNEAFSFCIADSTRMVPHLLARWVHCPQANMNTSTCLNDTSWQKTNDYTWGNRTGASELAVYMEYNTFDVIYDASGNIISALDNNPTLSQTPVAKAADLMSMFNFTLANQSLVDSNGNLDPSYTGSNLITNVVTLLQASPGQETSDVFASENFFFLSFILAPVVTFLPPYLSHYAGSSVPASLLSPQNLNVILTARVDRIYVALWTTIVYLVIAVALYAWCNFWLFWTMRLNSPPDSSFPLVDFVARVAATDGDEEGESLIGLFEGLGGADEELMRDRFAGKRVWLGTMANSREVPAATTSQDGNEKSVESVVVEGPRSIWRTLLSLRDNVQPLKSGNLYD